MEANKVYGVYFIKGAFFMKLKEVEDNLVYRVLVSKNYKQLKEVISGSYSSLQELLDSKNGALANKYIQELDFDYMVIGNGDTVKYYLNTTEGLVYCEVAYYTDKN